MEYITMEEDWLCAWCAIYGKYPVEAAVHPASEKGVLTADNEVICQSCATNWAEGKKEDVKINQERKEANSK